MPRASKKLMREREATDEIITMGNLYISYSAVIASMSGECPVSTIKLLIKRRNEIEATIASKRAKFVEDFRSDDNAEADKS